MGLYYHMPRPSTISLDDLQRWDFTINSDSQLDPKWSSNPIFREVLYAGQYLSDQLRLLHCSETLIGQILYSAGQMSFGRKDPWEIHLEILQRYLNNSLIFEQDIVESN
jgi:hypothetical protein